MIRRTFMTLGLFLIGGIAGSGGVRAQSSADATPAIAVDLDAAADYCVEQGGIVRTRVATLGTNLDPAQWVTLGSPKEFCEFTGHADDGGDSWITLSLETLASERPTLATLVYLTKPALPENTGGANPAAVYCSQLGGTYDFGTNLSAGGGWVTTDPEPALQVIEYCTFADGSMIDAWGLTYHTGGVVRGADLNPILRYQATEYPAVWG